MKNIFELILVIMIFNFSYSHSQTNEDDHQYEISFGRGSSIYDESDSQQYLFFYKLPKLNGKSGSISYSTDLNLELILENHKTAYVAGVVPMIRYDINLFNINPFIKAGIGFNFVNLHEITQRNIGGHFIFSDMISIGAKLLEMENFTLEISYLFRHISNAGFFDGNEGFNSQYLVISLLM